MLHAFQTAMPLAFGCAGDEWFGEATGVWSESYFYPPYVEPPEARAQFLFDYVLHHDLPLFDWSLTPYGELPGVGAYPFFVHLERSLGPGAVFESIRRAWEINGLAAIDVSVPGGFAEQFKIFAAHSWGEPPFDGMPDILGLAEAPARRHATLDMPPGVDHRVWNPENPDFIEPAAFDLFWFEVGDDRPGELRFNNPLDGLLDPEQAASAGVQLIFKKDGEAQWMYEDLTDSSGRSFCLNVPGEDFDEFGVIISNGLWDVPTPPFKEPFVEGWSSCTWWEGWASLTYRRESRTSNLIYFQYNVTVEDLVLLPASTSGLSGARAFEVDSGTLTTWAREGTTETSGQLTTICTYDSEVVVEPASKQSGFIGLPEADANASVGPVRYFGRGEAPPRVLTTRSAHPSCNREVEWDIGVFEWLRTNLNEDWRESPNPELLHDAFSGQIDNDPDWIHTFNWSWRFERMTN
jgi:hypothetical protein